MSMGMKAKGGGCPGADCPGCGAAVCMSGGGEIGVHPVASGDAGYEGRSVAGRSVANKTKHGDADAKKEHIRVLSELKSMKKPHLYAEGGEVSDDDLVMRIMKKRYSEGGQVANDTPIIADLEENQFDDLVKDDDLEFSETGANSGDELGDDAEDKDREDIVDRIMKSRSKKDKNPRPA